MIRPLCLALASTLAAACIENPPGEPLPLAQVQLGPWTMEPQAGQITVAWTTRLPTSGRVVFAPLDGSEKARAASDGALATDHRVKLTGLTAGVRYGYTILGDVLSHGSFIAPPDPQADPSAHPFRVLVYGDNRTNGGDHALVVRAAESEGAALALHTGDMVVNAKDQAAWTRWFDVERDLLSTTPIVPTVGNHEITDQGVTYSRHFKAAGGLPYHSLDYGNLHIQVLDSFEIQAGADPHAGAVSEAQKAWAAEDAKAVPQDHHLWMLVHQGLQTHPKDMRPGHGGLPGVRDLIGMVRKVHPVEAVFAGHEHFYERGDYDGIHYFVIGGGGAPLEEPDTAGEGVKLAIKQLSFVTLDVCGCHVTGAAHDLQGKVFDSFTLADCEKPCAAPLPGAAPEAGSPKPEAQPADAGTK